jgi:hypothetical protein
MLSPIKVFTNVFMFFCLITKHDCIVVHLVALKCLLKKEENVHKVHPTFDSNYLSAIWKPIGPWALPKL